MAFDFFGRKKRNEDLMVSILNGDHREVDRLLQNKANPNFEFKTKVSESSGITPLYTAMLANGGPNLQIIQSLLNKGANPNTIVYNAHYTNRQYESLLLLTVKNAGTATDEESRRLYTDVYCALRFANADMHCTPSKHQYKGDMSFANMDYMEWDISIDGFLNGGDHRAVWESLEQNYETRRQKKNLNEELEQQLTTAQPSRRLKL